jgi:hypothetical protein
MISHPWQLQRWGRAVRRSRTSAGGEKLTVRLGIPKSLFKMALQRIVFTNYDA